MFVSSCLSFPASPLPSSVFSSLQIISFFLLLISSVSVCLFLSFLLSHPPLFHRLSSLLPWLSPFSSFYCCLVTESQLIYTPVIISSPSVLGLLEVGQILTSSVIVHQSLFSYLLFWSFFAFWGVKSSAFSAFFYLTVLYFFRLVLFLSILFRQCSYFFFILFF